MIRASSISSVEGFEQFIKLLPLNDATFDAADAVEKCDKIGFFNDGEPCGIALCLVAAVGGRRVFFINALAVSTDADGGAVYNWLEYKAREMGCDVIAFDSPRKGMLWNSRRFGWEVSNVRYQKYL